ncbi:GntR family transcriptional regulator [Cellulosilyticum sp. I15G10I2]|uniref:GntR family transcriptional regulator n=1 Tax=Cellulosilyticum sp. I15G10I2 TaxID=1892843 RepID=UPI001495A2B4|nr:GntR family transcriptional regulator [Cellulosilyticum sp. I15G10I2]
MSILNGVIKRESPIPLYYQLKEIILSELTSNRLVSGDYLPTENELMAYYQISRATVRQAMSELVNEGYLSRQKGKGTFVSKPKITQQSINRVETYQEKMRKIGKNAGTKVVYCDIIMPSATICQALSLSKQHKVIRLVRIRLVDEEPIVVAETYMPYNVCSFVLEHDLESESLYAILSENEKTRIVTAKRTIEAVLASESAAKMLEITEGDALQVIKTIALNKENIVIEYTTAKYRGDRNLFIVETQVEV